MPMGESQNPGCITLLYILKPFFRVIYKVSVALSYWEENSTPKSLSINQVKNNNLLRLNENATKLHVKLRTVT